MTELAPQPAGLAEPTPLLRSPRPRRAWTARPGCLAALSALLVVAGVAGFIAVRTYQQPALGAPPQGPFDGATEAEIARTLGLDLATAMVGHEHASVILSEQDLTVLARAHNPEPERLVDPQVRIRDGMLAVDAQTDIGPRTAVVVGWLDVLLDTSTATPHLATQIDHVDVGTLTLPGWAAGALDSRLSSVIQLDRMFQGSAALVVLQHNLECLVLTSKGAELGFHRPGVAPSTASCAPG